MTTYIFKIYFYILTFASFFAILLYSLTGSPLFFSLPAFKDLSMFLIFFLVFASIMLKCNYFVSKELSVIILLSIFFLLSVFYSFFISSSEFYIKVTSLRRFISFIVAIITFALVQIKMERVNDLVRTLVLINVALFLFGCVEYLMSEYLWDVLLNIGKYWKDSGDKFASDSISVNGKFYNFDLYPITHQLYRRMVSFYSESTTFAAFISFSYSVSVILDIKKRYKFIVLLMGLLTFSKAFLLGVIVTLFLKKRKYSHKFIVIITLVFFIISYIFSLLGLKYGPFSHLYGLYTGFLNIFKGNILGNGVGLGGNFANFSILKIDPSGSESGLGSMLSQIGIFGILFVIIIYKASKVLYIRFLESKNRIFLALHISLCVWYCQFLYSESALGISGNIFVFIFVGLLIGVKNKGKINYEEKNIISNTSTSLSPD